jgi:hypothetical protein
MSTTEIDKIKYNVVMKDAASGDRVVTSRRSERASELSERLKALRRYMQMLKEGRVKK